MPHSLFPAWDANGMSEPQQPCCDYELTSKGQSQHSRDGGVESLAFEQLVHSRMGYSKSACYEENNLIFIYATFVGFSVTCI